MEEKRYVTDDGPLVQIQHHPPAGGKRSARRAQKRIAIKAVAQRLFAQGGLDRVSTRDIVEAAGQRNVALVSYYFGSRDALITELIEDTMAAISADRIIRLDALLGGAESAVDIRAVLDIMFSQPRLDSPERSESHGRFIAMLVINHRDWLLKATGNQLDPGSQRCLVLLRRLLPEMPREEMRARINITMLLFVAAMAAHEGAGTDAGRDDLPYVIDPDREHLLDAAEAILLRPSRRVCA